MEGGFKRFFNRSSVFSAFKPVLMLAFFGALIFSIANLVQAEIWQGPTNQPPLDNVAAPLSQSTIFKDSDGKPIGTYNRLQIATSTPASSLLAVLKNGSDASAFSGGIILGKTTATWMNLGGAFTAGWIHSTKPGENNIAGNFKVAGLTMLNQVSMGNSDNTLRLISSNSSNQRSAVYFEHQSSGNQSGAIYLGTGYSLTAKGIVNPIFNKTNKYVGANILKINNSGFHYYLNSGGSGVYTPVEKFTIIGSDTVDISVGINNPNPKKTLDIKGELTVTGQTNIGGGLYAEKNLYTNAIYGSKGNDEVNKGTNLENIWLGDSNDTIQILGNLKTNNLIADNINVDNLTASNLRASFLTATGNEDSRLVLGYGAEDITKTSVWVLDNYHEPSSPPNPSDKFFRIFPQIKAGIPQDDWDNYFVMNNVNGNVGLGTGTPNTKLDVNGTTTVSGAIIAKSGVRINTLLPVNSRPICNAAIRGTIWMTLDNNKDSLLICVWTGSSFFWKKIF